MAGNWNNKNNGFFKGNLWNVSFQINYLLDERTTYTRFTFYLLKNCHLLIPYLQWACPLQPHCYCWSTILEPSSEATWSSPSYFCGTAPKKIERLLVGYSVCHVSGLMWPNDITVCHWLAQWTVCQFSGFTCHTRALNQYFLHSNAFECSPPRKEIHILVIKLC